MISLDTNVINAFMGRGFLLFFFAGFLFKSFTAMSSEITLDNSLNYTFEPKFDCKKNFKPIQKCIVSKPKDFSLDEKKVILTSLKKLELSKASYFFDKLSEKKKTIKFYRQTYGTTSLNTKTFKQNNATVGWVDIGNKDSIHITDRFFQILKKINDQFSFHDYLLLHELSHLLDNNLRGLSGSKAFLNLYDWHQVNTKVESEQSSVDRTFKRWQTTVPYQAVDRIRQTVSDLSLEGMKQEATLVSLSFGQAHGHPTSYSMTNPFENFSELVTHYFIDPESMKTVPYQVTVWLNELFQNN